MPLRPRALLTLIVALGLQVAPAYSDSPSNQSARLNLTTLTISDAISEAEAWQSSQPQSQCCMATADLCCPAGTVCRPPGGCIALAVSESVPESIQPMGTEPEQPEGFHSTVGAGPLGTMVVAVLVVSCACLCLLACCAKQLCACLFDPGPDGEWSGAQMGMAGLAGAAAGYELENMMDGYGGRPGYGGGFGGPGFGGGFGGPGYGGGFGGPAW
jgi:hypothetical protein